jgi:hypothetical protein
VRDFTRMRTTLARTSRIIGVLSLSAGLMLVGLATTAIANVSVDEPGRSYFCQQPIGLGILRSWRGEQTAFWAHVRFETSTGHVLNAWDLTAPRRGVRQWTYTPHLCGKTYRVVYVTPGSTYRFELRVSSTIVGSGAP